MSEYRDISSNSRPRTTQNSGEHYSRRNAIRKRQQRNQRILLVVAILVIIAIIVSLIVLLSPKKDKDLIGTWQYNEYTKYEFYDNGQGCLCADDVHYKYEYKLSGDTLKLDFAEDIVRDCEYLYAVENKTLTLTGGEGTDGGTYTLSKTS